ncbi:hypothetical protein AAVH_43079, partial [Aphelenchoides avenae]
YDYQVVVASTYGPPEFYSRCLENTTDCFTIQSYMATNVFVTRHNVSKAQERAVRAQQWLIDHRTAIEHTLREFGTASSLEAVFEAIVTQTGNPLQTNGFHGIVLLRNWAFSAPQNCISLSTALLKRPLSSG